MSSTACRALQYFSTLSHKLHDLKKNVTEHKKCFDFLYNFCLKHFSFLENSARHYHKRKYVFMSRTRYSYQNLIKLWFSVHIFEKYSYMTLHENPSSRRRVVSCGRTDMTKPMVAVRNFAVNAPRNLQYICPIMFQHVSNNLDFGEFSISCLTSTDFKSLQQKTK